ncbi:MAG: nucleotidyltransferase domain-containing protein [Desulfuromonadales bacterium]|nr:nucleotidyltransferase domain-containing protein [Desulfuromonadales bacterium]
MQNTILANLEQIEQEQNVRILFAVESGSRAWGFASKDSDYDVRFIYLHPLEWYLSIRKQRDVIECPISGDLDISGWDLPKALGLFRKSNPPLLEWIGSPHVYLDRYGLADRLRELMADYYSPKRCMLHYLHMARGNFREYLKGETVRIKKYFYVLRPVLACLWIEKHNCMPPTEFDELYKDAGLSPSISVEIDRLLLRKIAGDELDMEPKIEVINAFLEQQIDHCSDFVEGMEMVDVDEDVLDEFFREMLGRVWKSEPAI